LARRPFGGSLVILIPFCSTETGNFFEGIEVSHKRKDGSVLLGSMSSTSFSSVAIHETKRWQFISSTHRPCSLPVVMSFSALGPCPCPSEMKSSLLSMPACSAYCSRPLTGSAPALSTKMSGMVTDASW